MEDTRERLLEIALTAFSGRGYNAVGIQELCEAAGITKPSLYYHFGNKRGLLEAIALDRYEPFLQESRAASMYHGDLHANLRGHLTLGLRSAREKPAFTRLRLSLNFAPADSEEASLFRSYAVRHFELVQGLFRSAEADHGNMKGRSAQYAASFIGMADAHASLLLSGDVEYGDEDTERLTHYFMHGIFS